MTSTTLQIAYFLAQSVSIEKLPIIGMSSSTRLQLEPAYWLHLVGSFIKSRMVLPSDYDMHQKLHPQPWQPSRIRDAD